MDLLPTEFLKAQFLMTLPEAKQGEYSGMPQAVASQLWRQVALIFWIGVIKKLATIFK